MKKTIFLPLPGPLTKDQLRKQVPKFMTSPNYTPAQKLAACRRLGDLIGMVQKELVETVLSEMEGDSLEVDGITFTAQCRNTYSFDHDPVVAQLEAQLKARKALMRKAAEPGVIILDEETGEEIPPAIVQVGTPFLKANY